MNATRPSTNRYKDTQDKAEDTGAGTVTINNDAAYIKANGTSYIVDEQTAFVDVDEKTLYTGFENVRLPQRHRHRLCEVLGHRQHR